MNKNTIIALVIGLVIGGLVIWLLMFFAQGTSFGTYLGLKIKTGQTVTPESGTRQECGCWINKDAKTWSDVGCTSEWDLSGPTKCTGTCTAKGCQGQTCGILDWGAGGTLLRTQGDGGEYR